MKHVLLTGSQIPKNKSWRFNTRMLLPILQVQAHLGALIPLNNLLLITINKMAIIISN